MERIVLALGFAILLGGAAYMHALNSFENDDSISPKVYTIYEAWKN